MTAAVIGAGAAAHAECPVTLAGDPDTVVRVQHALVAFGGDDAACVSLRATCSADPEHAGGIVLELQDAFGRSAHRTVASIDGAVAMLVSWSRRPVPLDPTEDHAPPPHTVAVADTTLTAHAAPAPAPDGYDTYVDRPPEPLLDHDRQIEIRVQTIGAPVAGKTAFDVDVATVRRRGILRYGVDLRLIESSGNDYQLIDGSALSSLFSFDASGVLGVVLGKGRLLGHAEAAVGATTVAGVSSENSPVYQTQGLRVGARGAFAVRVVGTMWLELGGGWDGLLRVGPQSANSAFHREWLATPHLDAGFLWVL